MIGSIAVWVLFLWMVFSSIKYAFEDLELTWFKKAQFLVLYLMIIWFLTVVISGIGGFVLTHVYNALCIPVDWLNVIIVQNLK